MIRALILTLASVSLAHASEPKSSTFIACPIYRDADSGRKSGCWLTDDPATGARYDVSAAPMKPQRGRAVLVEGVESGDADACGGITLRPVRTSQLETPCVAVMIPAEGYAGRRFNVPADAQRPTWEPRTLPPPPYQPSDFNIFFDFNNDFMIYQHAEIVLEKALLYANASRAKEIIVTGYAATRPLKVSNVELQESMSLARSRAEVVTTSLLRLGIPREKIKTKWQADPTAIASPHAPTAESSKRRVTIHVIPSADANAK